eukprot:CAMPEP_0178413300 /NCGR_PEP_ID=MMETSP0689_2-20121128/22457_1 /TAXON_ID=160604 /ORGANISM="Amphidinium massartii, Strain CS-259" /LENGTH=331 /DNA_ID=CAMNT_0020034569 /DNA_START=22 /DNA_END=1014 /DNA_ORIENTATION=-
MHAVVMREVIPRTKGTAKSAALIVNPLGKKITTFVTHTWEEDFRDFVDTLEMALEMDEVVWICSLALDQNADIEEMLSVDIDECPFAKALAAAEKHVIVVDSALRLIERAWCLYEVAKSSQLSIPLFLWTSDLRDLPLLAEKVHELDVRNATATFQKDLDTVQAAIAAGIGHDAMNHRIKAYMGDRLHFYQAAVSRSEGMLQELMQKLQLHKERAGASEVYMQQLRSQLRHFQEEAEHKFEVQALREKLEKQQQAWELTEKELQESAHEQEQLLAEERRAREAAEAREQAMKEEAVEQQRAEEDEKVTAQKSEEQQLGSIHVCVVPPPNPL